MLPKFAFLLLLFLTGLCGSFLHAQDHLYLENPGRFKRIEIEPGDTVLFSLKGEKWRYGSRVRGARDGWVFLRMDSVRVTEIDALWTRPEPGQRYFLGMVQGAAIMAAVVYPVMILLNRTAVTGYENKDLREMLIVSGSALSVYFLLKVFRWKKRNLEKGHWKLVVRERV